ncbi:unnamed protein product [Menidia menidia]|uniref:(Atlantic silverside) hypothetical protein n=1 Tax=Menidia menidia TaxID=238744 RepID=A0A8S4C302_9TELE|nr:unnamed protein product [Menidia menidia]
MWLLKVFSLACLTAVCAGQDDSHVTRTIQENELVTTKPQPDPPTPILQRLTKWSDVFETEELQFRCEVNGTEWTYSWYKNNEKLHEEQSLLTISSVDHTHEGQYSCKTHLKSKGVESESSNTVDVKVYTKPKPTVTRSSDYAMMYPKEPIDFTCKVDVSSEWEYVWYHNGTEISDSSSEKHTIHTIGHPDSGKYHCKAKRGSFYTEASGTINLQVSDPPTPILRRLTKWLDVFKNEELQFGCEVNGAEWTYSWYKNKEKLHEDQSLLTISSVDHTHEGQYSCKAHLKSRVDSEFSNTDDVKVYEIPVPSVRPLTQWLDIFPTEGVQLSCRMQGSSGWKYTWYKNAEKVQVGKTVKIENDGSRLTISSSSTSDRGKYSCFGKLEDRSVISSFSSNLTLYVYDTIPKATIVQNPKASLMHTEDWVSLSCHVNVSSGWDYMWFKDESSLVSSGNTHNISSVVVSDSGSYKCKVKRGNVFKPTQSEAIAIKIEERPQAEIILQTKWLDAFATDSLALKCEVKDENSWNFTWFMENDKLEESTSERHIVTPNNDPEQHPYTCQGVRQGRPFYSKMSAPLKTKNLLLKRRILLSISGLLFFGIIAIFLGCIALKFFRKPAAENELPDENDLFLSMTKTKDSPDGPCPLVEFITEASLKASPKAVEENGEICSETTSLPIILEENQAVMTDTNNATENGCGLVSFKA